MNKVAKNLILLPLLLAIFVSNISFACLPVGTAHAEISTDSLISLVNNSRTQEGFVSLSYNSKLQEAAEKKAADMFKDQYFAHISPSGETPWDFIKSAGYTYVYAGENLAIGYTDNNELHTAWMNSPTHRENIMNPNYREIGIASVNGVYEGVETTIVVQEFGSTTTTQPVTQLKNVQSAGNTAPSTQDFSNPKNNSEIVTNTPENQTVISGMILEITNHKIMYFSLLILMTLIFSGYFVFGRRKSSKLT